MVGSRKDKRRANEKTLPGAFVERTCDISLTVEEQGAIYSAIFAYAPYGMAFADQNLIVCAANESFAKMIGLPLDKVLGRSVEELVPVWTEQAGHIYRNVRKIGQPFKAEEYPVVFKNQPERGVTYWDFSVSPVYGSECAFLGYLLLVREVTERKRIQEELRLSRERFRSMCAATPIGIELYDSAFRLIEANRSCLEIFGVSDVAEMRAFNPFDELHVSQEARERLLKGEPIEYDVQFDFERAKSRKAFKTRKSGIVYLHVLISSLGPKEQKPLSGYLVQIQDVTERRLAEEALRKARDELEMRVKERTAELAKAIQQLQTEVAERKRVEATLRESEARFRKVFEEGPLGMALVGRNYRFVKVNSMLCRILGYTEQELTSRTFVDVTYPEDIERSVRMVELLYKGEIPYMQTEKQYVRKTGEIIWANLIASIIRDEEGRPLYHLAMVQDITERKRAEEEREALLRQLRGVNQQLVITSTQAQNQAEVARRRASELETIIESIADGVFLCDKDGRIIEVNEAGLKLIGLVRKEEILRPLVGYLSLLNLRHPDGRPIAVEDLALTRALRGEVVTGHEEIARGLQTQRDIYLLVSAAPIRDEAGNVAGAVEVLSDISHIKEFDKLKDEFISVAAHELKTPVAIMKGYAQALLRAPEVIPPPRQRMLDSINRGADRIDRIVKDLLDISRLHIGRLEISMESIDLPELTEDVVSRLALVAPKHHIRVVSAEPVVVQGDRDRLEQVLVNLIDNAIKYSPQGGNIDVKVAVRNREAVVSVRDHGVGIPKEKQGHIFERFYRAHADTPYDYGGMGVGLYISREIISQHGGRMWFESEEGKGSTFSFSLPLQG